MEKLTVALSTTDAEARVVDNQFGAINWLPIHHGDFPTKNELNLSRGTGIYTPDLDQSRFLNFVVVTRFDIPACFASLGSLRFEFES